VKEHLRHGHYQEGDRDARVEYDEEDYGHEDHPEISSEKPLWQVEGVDKHREDVHWRDQDVEDDDARGDDQDEEEGAGQEEEEATCGASAREPSTWVDIFITIKIIEALELK